MDEFRVNNNQETAPTREKKRRIRRDESLLLFCFFFLLYFLFCFLYGFVVFCFDRFVRCRLKADSAVASKMRVNQIPSLACYKVTHQPIKLVSVNPTFFCWWRRGAVDGRLDDRTVSSPMSLSKYQNMLLSLRGDFRPQKGGQRKTGTAFVRILARIYNTTVVFSSFSPVNQAQSLQK